MQPSLPQNKHAKKTSLLIMGFALAHALAGCSTPPSEIKLDEKAENSSIKVESKTSLPVVKIQGEYLSRSLEIPGELRAYQNVSIEAKESGYVSWIGVDRGSAVKRGEKMMTIFCPELEEKVKEQAEKVSSAESSLAKGQANLESIKSRQIEAQARLDADKLTLSRLQMTAKKMPGAIAVNDIDVQTKTVESDVARVSSVKSEISAGEHLISSAKSDVGAAEEVLKSVQSLRAYLTISAPFDGIVMERNVHEGSMVGPGDKRGEQPMLRVLQQNILRLVVAVPEDSVSALKKGQEIDFTVPAFLGQKFRGVVARPAYSLDPATRTMPVELSVSNKDNRLNPGMFATVYWQVTKPYKTLFVPASAVATDLKGTFVVAVKNGVAERIPVQKGQAMGNRVEIVGDVKESELVAETATNEIKDGVKLSTKVVSSGI